jgi:hypothetical protein
MAPTGVLGGLVFGLMVLVVLSIALLATPGSGPRVLIAVWFWTLPVLGVGALAGWAVESLIRRIVRGDATVR